MSEKEDISFAVLVKQLRDNLPGMLEHAVLDAKIKRAKYIALVKEGFTKEEAFILCR